MSPFRNKNMANKNSKDCAELEINLSLKIQIYLD